MLRLPRPLPLRLHLPVAPCHASRLLLAAPTSKGNQDAIAARWAHLQRTDLAWQLPDRRQWDDWVALHTTNRILTAEANPLLPDAEIRRSTVVYGGWLHLPVAYRLDGADYPRKHLVEYKRTPATANGKSLPLAWRAQMVLYTAANRAEGMHLVQPVGPNVSAAAIEGQFVRFDSALFARLVQGAAALALAERASVDVPPSAKALAQYREEARRIVPVGHAWPSGVVGGFCPSGV